MMARRGSDFMDATVAKPWWNRNRQPHALPVCSCSDRSTRQGGAPATRGASSQLVLVSAGFDAHADDQGAGSGERGDTLGR